MITGDMIVCHLVGDYVLQSDYMAGEKTKQSFAALLHATTYTLPFAFLTQSLWALGAILATHFVIDRWRLARYVCWLKNFLGPPCSIDAAGNETARWWYSWAECRATGYQKDRPIWLTTWLLIIADNTLHLLCNGLAIKYLGT